MRKNIDPPDHLIARAAEVLSARLGRPATPREAREFVVQIWRYFSILRDAEDKIASVPKPDAV